MNSLGKLNSLGKSLIRSNKLGDNNKIIQEQINENVNEKINELKHLGRGNSYICRINLLFENLHEAAKMRIVYDSSAKSNKDSVSLNKYLQTGPPL